MKESTREMTGVLLALGVFVGLVIFLFAVLTWLLMVSLGAMHIEIAYIVPPLSFGDTSLVSALLVIVGALFNWTMFFGLASLSGK